MREDDLAMTMLHMLFEASKSIKDTTGLDEKITLKLHEDELGEFEVEADLVDFLECTDMISMDKEITKHMEVGKIYNYGIGNMAENYSEACWLVRVGIDKEHLFTTASSEPESTCIVIPADKLVEWTKPKTKENE